MRCLPFASTLAAASLLAQGDAPDHGRDLDRLCRPLIEAGIGRCFVVGVIDGDTTLVRGYGTLAHGSTAKPADDTVFEIGSVSKVFTGLLLADAVQRRAVALADPVQKLLPGNVAMPSWEEQPVLLWHLATHTSGLPRLPDMKGADSANPYAHFTAERLHGALAGTRVRSAPGDEYEYSNLGFGLLGHVLARRQGFAGYDALLQARIAVPLQMTDTVIAVAADRAARTAPPHDADGEPAHAWDLAELAGAGGIRSTMRDMLKFARLQSAPSGPLADAVRLSQQKHHDGAHGRAVGLGWHFARDGVTLWHNGETAGYHSYLAVVPSSRRAVCVLANAAGGAIDGLGERIVQQLHGQAAEPQKFELPVAVDRAELARLAGRYRMPPGLTLTIELRERGLFAQLTGQPALRLHPRSPTEFFYRAVEASITFDRDGDAVRALVLHQNGRDIRCERAEAAGR